MINTSKSLLEIQFTQENEKEFQLFDMEKLVQLKNLNLEHVTKATVTLEQLKVTKASSDPQIKRIDELLCKFWSMHIDLTEQAEKLFRVGYDIYQKRDYHSAKAKFDEAISLNSRHVASHHYKAGCLQKDSDRCRNAKNEWNHASSQR